jgi:hypothetical protein
MSVEDISEIWAKDSPIDETNLIGESKRIPQLHSKYYNMYFKEVLRVKKHKAEYKELERLKREYYDGSMAEETLKEHGWKPFKLKVLRNDLDRYVQSDKDVIAKSLTVDYYSARANFLEDIIKTIHSRNFIVKNMIDVLKFQAGEY